MHRGRLLAVVAGVLAICATQIAQGELREQPAGQQTSLEETPASQSGTAPAAATDPSKQQTQQKLARVWANEPPLVRLARDKFGAELTETDAKFFAAVADSSWADLRVSKVTKYNPEDPSSWAKCTRLPADRLNWLCTDPVAVKIVPSRGIWLRGAYIEGKIDLYRNNVPFSLTFVDCLFAEGLNISHAKLQELNCRNCCSAPIQARGVQVAESVYLLSTSVFGGLDFIEAQIGGNFDFSGGLAFRGGPGDDPKKPGIALNFHDAKISGDLKLTDKFRALGQVRLICAQVGHTFSCQNGRFKSGGTQPAIDARSINVTSDIQFNSGFRAEGGVDICQAHVSGDLDCSGGRFIHRDGFDEAISAESVNIGGQVNLSSGCHAEGEVRLYNAVVGGDVHCTNGHFLNPAGNALNLDGATIGRSLRIAADKNLPTDPTKDLPTGFVSRGQITMCGARINQDLIAGGARLEMPSGFAILANNLRVGGRVDLTSINSQGCVCLFAADIEHELDLRCSQLDAKDGFNHIAFWANGMHVRGHVYCNQVDTPDGPQRLQVKGLASFQFSTIAMNWDLSGAQFTNPGESAFDASDCRVGGYVVLDHVLVDGTATFSRAKIDGVWVLTNSVEPQKMRLDMRFAHIWVIKDERLDDWPPDGQLQLEGLVYDHFDDDSPLDVNDRLAWLRRQYAPIKKHAKIPARKTADLRPARTLETFGQTTVRGPENLAKQGDIVPINYEAGATMPAPQPTPTPGTANPQTSAPAEKANSGPHQMVVTAEEINGKPADAASQTDAKKAEATTGTKSATAATTPEPFGRRYITQPYTQLASVYRAIGQDEQANDVLVARAERLGELSPPFSAQGLWYRYLGRLIGYGYEPFRAIKIGLVIIAFGAVMFAVGNRRHLMAETNLAERVVSSADESGMVSPTYPRFNAIVYSLDVFLPFVDLNQVSYWIPGEKISKPRTSRNCLMHVGRYSVKWSSVLHGYLWFQTLAGWTLCTLLAAAVTGIVQS